MLCDIFLVWKSQEKKINLKILFTPNSHSLGHTKRFTHHSSSVVKLYTSLKVIRDAQLSQKEFFFSPKRKVFCEHFYSFISTNTFIIIIFLIIIIMFTITLRKIYRIFWWINVYRWIRLIYFLTLPSFPSLYYWLQELSVFWWDFNKSWVITLLTFCSHVITCGFCFADYFQMRCVMVDFITYLKEK